jgi:hypothetical protein
MAARITELSISVTPMELDVIRKALTTHRDAITGALQDKNNPPGHDIIDDIAIELKQTMTLLEDLK